MKILTSKAQSVFACYLLDLRYVNSCRRACSHKSIFNFVSEEIQYCIGFTVFKQCFSFFVLFFLTLSTFHSIVNSCFYRFVMYWFKLIKVCYKHWRRMIFTTEKLWNGSLDLFFFVCVPLPVVHNVLWQADVNIEVWYKHYYISQSVGTYDWSN